MPTSEKQIEANKRNAKKSTGPKSKEGKAASSLNAVKHGLYTENIIINSPYLREDPEEYQELVDSLIEDLQPESSIQKHLVLKIANCLWRSNRALAAETAEIKAQLDEIDDDLRWKYYFKRKRLQETNEDFDPETDEVFTREELDDLLTVMAGQRSIPDQSANNNILHYQMRLDRQIANAYQLLANLKRSRKRNRRNEKRRNLANSENKNQRNEPILDSRSKREDGGEDGGENGALCCTQLNTSVLSHPREARALCCTQLNTSVLSHPCEGRGPSFPCCQEPLPDSNSCAADVSVCCTQLNTSVLSHPCEGRGPSFPCCQEPLPDSSCASDEGFDNVSQAQTEFEPATRPWTIGEDGPCRCKRDTHDRSACSSFPLTRGTEGVSSPLAPAPNQRRITTDEEARQSMSELKGIYDDVPFGEDA